MYESGLKCFASAYFKNDEGKYSSKKKKVHVLLTFIYYCA